MTARKSSEALQTTPVAVTAITTQVMERRQIKEVGDIVRATPNLSSNGGGTAPASIVYLSIRGNVQVSPNSASDSAVGIYIDGVYVGRPMIGNLGLLDMAGAEVLRGPQGTLFGRNTTGGALTLTTAQPTDTFEGMFRAGVGNYDQRLVEGMINTPLSDTLSLRVAGRYNERSGYTRNALNNTRMNGIDGDYYARASLKWTPDDKPLELFLSAEYTRYRDNGQAAQMTHVIGQGTGVQVDETTFIPGINFLALADTFAQTPTAFGGFGLTPATPNSTLVGTLASLRDANGFYTVLNDPATGSTLMDTPYNKNTSKGFNATLKVDLGGVELKSITGYRRSFTTNSLDLDGGPNLYFNPDFDTGTYTWGLAPAATNAGFESLNWLGLAFYSRYKQQQFSEELQLSGTTGKLDWIVGAYGYHENGKETSDSWQLFQFAFDSSNFKAKSYGLFAQGNYHLTDRLRATAGFRYTWDSRYVNLHGGTGKVLDQGNLVIGDTTLCGVGPNASLTAPYNAATCNDPHSVKFSYPSWLASLDYKFSDTFFGYLKTSGAALSGGFNVRPVPENRFAFKPEKVKDIELGFKADLLDRKLRTNLAFYYMLRNGVQNQLNGLVGGRSTQYVVNSGKIRSYGVEAEVTALPWEGMELSAGGAYLNTRYKSGSFQDLDLGATQAAGSKVFYDRSDEPVLQSPKWTMNVGATQTFPTSFGSVSLHADYSYRSKSVIAYVSAPPSVVAAGGGGLAAYQASNAASFIKGYGLVNARATVNIDDPDIEVALWVKNLANKKYYQQMFNLLESLGYEERFQGPPRMYGVTATVRFQ